LVLTFCDVLERKTRYRFQIEFAGAEPAFCPTFADHSGSKHEKKDVGPTFA
jgi:hypothetical protein